MVGYLGVLRLKRPRQTSVRDLWCFGLFSRGSSVFLITSPSQHYHGHLKPGPQNFEPFRRNIQTPISSARRFRLIAKPKSQARIHIITSLQFRSNTIKQLP
jgi:hypothetical protein